MKLLALLHEIPSFVWVFIIIFVISAFSALFFYSEIKSFKKQLIAKIANISKNEIMATLLADDLKIFGWEEKVTFYETTHPFNANTWLRIIFDYLCQIEEELEELKKVDHDNIRKKLTNVEWHLNKEIKHIVDNHICEGNYQREILCLAKTTYSQIGPLLRTAPKADLKKLYVVAAYHKVQLRNFHLLK